MLMKTANQDPYMKQLDEEFANALSLLLGSSSDIPQEFAWDVVRRARLGDYNPYTTKHPSSVYLSPIQYLPIFLRDYPPLLATAEELFISIYLFGDRDG